MAIDDDPLLRLDASIIKLLALRQQAIAKHPLGTYRTGDPPADYLDNRTREAAAQGLDVAVVDMLFGQLPHPAPLPPLPVLQAVPAPVDHPPISMTLTMYYPLEEAVHPDEERARTMVCPTCQGSTFVRTEAGEEQTCPSCGSIGYVVPDPRKKTEPKVRPAMYVVGPPRPGPVHDWTCGGKLKRRPKRGPAVDAQGRVWNRLAYAPAVRGSLEHQRLLEGLMKLIELGKNRRETGPQPATGTST
jgi:hypothetical protein